MPNNNQLIQKIETFFNMKTNTIQTKSHLYVHLGYTESQVQKLKESPEVKEILEIAENICNLQVIEHGFQVDKSFGRWYLERYQNPPEDVHRDIEPITITFDRGPSES